MTLLFINGKKTCTHIQIYVCKYICVYIYIILHDRMLKQYFTLKVILHLINCFKNSKLNVMTHLPPSPCPKAISSGGP